MRIFLAVLVLALLSSCSIEKRRHLSGWNVQWKGKSEVPKKIRKEEKMAVVKSDHSRILQEKPVIEESVAPTNVMASISDEIIVQPKKNVLERQEDQPSPNKDLKNEITKKTDWLAIAAFISLILAPFTFGITLPLAFILAAFSMWRNKRSPDKYKKSALWMSNIAFWIAAIVMMVAVPSLLFIFLYGEEVAYIIAALATAVLLLSGLMIGLKKPKE